MLVKSIRYYILNSNFLIEQNYTGGTSRKPGGGARSLGGDRERRGGGGKKRAKISVTYFMDDP